MRRKLWTVTVYLVMFVVVVVFYFVIEATAQDQSLTTVSSQSPPLPFLDLFTSASNYYSEPIRKSYSNGYYHTSCPKPDTLATIASILGSAAKIMLSAAVMTLLKLLGIKLLLLPITVMVFAKLGLKAILLWPVISKLMKYLRKKKNNSRMIMDCSERLTCVLERSSDSGWSSNFGSALTFTMIDDLVQDSIVAKTALRILAGVKVAECMSLECNSERDPNVFMPPEFRRAPSEMGVNLIAPNSNFAPREYQVPRQQIIHTGVMQSPPLTNAEKVPIGNPVSSFNEVLNAIKGNGFSEIIEQENQKRRTAIRDDDVNNKKASSNGYQRENYDSWTPLIHDSGSLHVPSPTNEHQSNKGLPKFSLLEPVTTKISSKTSGLMNLILALLGSGSDGFVMKGFKDVIIDGILKPLLVAKGGLKVLISRLTIPLIALLLINIEVLVTVWWLWDDCPQPTVYQSTYAQPVPYKHAYSQPVTNSYNYNMTYK